MPESIRVHDHPRLVRSLQRKLELEQGLGRLHPFHRQAVLAALLLELDHPKPDVLFVAPANLTHEELVVVVEHLRHPLEVDDLRVRHDKLGRLPADLGRRVVGRLRDDEVGICHCDARARER